MRYLPLFLTFGLAYGQAGMSSMIELKGLKMEEVEYKGRKAVRLTEAPEAKGDGQLAILKGQQFKDGVIDVWLCGDVAPGSFMGARGFAGVAFRVQDAASYEAFYLRPTNGRADDQVRRNHSAQYISHPDFPWQRLRKEFPEMYESYVDLAPGEWTQVRIEVSGRKAKLYVHGSPQPTLIVNDLKRGEASGLVALWIGPGTVAHFSGLKVTGK
jgi:hypothetical protein